MAHKIVRWIFKTLGRYKYNIILLEKRGNSYEIFFDKARYSGNDMREEFELYTTGEVVKPPPAEYILFPRFVFMAHHGQGNYSYVSTKEVEQDISLKAFMQAADKNWFAEAVMQNKRDLEKLSFIQKYGSYITILIMFVGAGIFMVLVQQAFNQAMAGMNDQLNTVLHGLQGVTGQLAGNQPPT